MSKKAGKQAAAKLLKRPVAGTSGSGVNGSALLSAYAAGLASDQLARYNNKISSIQHKDPYLLTMSAEALPLSVSYESIIDYALNKKSSYTGSSFHCFKALDSKSKYEAGMVKLVEGIMIGDKHVVRGKVMHSMSITNPCLTPWIVIEDSTILSAHCDCIAGIGEVCTHVGAVLYHLTHLHHQQLISSQVEEVAVTEREQQWGNPNKSITQNLQQQIQDIDYGYEVTSADDTLGNIPRLQVDELRDVFRTLSRDGLQCTVMQEFCDNGSCFRCENSRIDPDYLNEGVMLDNLYDLSLESYSIEQLHFVSLKMYGQMQSSMNEALQSKIEHDTIEQSKSDLWKKMRVGRITASVVKSVCCTNITKPAISTVKKICYPDLSYFSTQATRHGKSMEKVAFHQLHSHLVNLHINASFRECGLIVNINYPELAASPDGILNCECCIKVPIEIKCPFRFKNETDIILKLTKVSQPFIQVDNENYTLCRNHAYYAQVQMQIALTNAPYGYFYVWTKTEDLLIKVDKDLQYWHDMQAKSSNFFKVVILPELFAKFYTKKHEQEQQLKSLRGFRKMKTKQTSVEK